jgi:hemerythrin superfamily protein
MASTSSTRRRTAKTSTPRKTAKKASATTKKAVRSVKADAKKTARKTATTAKKAARSVKKDVKGTAKRTSSTAKKTARSVKAGAKKTAKKTAKKASRSGKKKTAERTSGTRATASRSPRSANDAVALIKADHSAVNDLFKRYRAAGKTAYKTKRSIADRVVRELSIHAAIEEQVMYPAVRQFVPKGEALVAEALSEHQQLKETLLVLDRLSPEDERFDRTMRAVIDETRHHVREEESADGMLARLRKSVDADDLVTMGKTLRIAKKAAPTRPHPNAPSTPPGNIVVGAAAALVDKARDAVRSR